MSDVGYRGKFEIRHQKSEIKKVKKLPVSSPHVDGKYHPPLLVVVVLSTTIIDSLSYLLFAVFASISAKSLAH
jgi:hypothetical protein